MDENIVDVNTYVILESVKFVVCYCDNRCTILWFRFDEILFPSELYLYIIIIFILHEYE